MRYRNSNPNTNELYNQSEDLKYFLEDIKEAISSMKEAEEAADVDTSSDSDATELKLEHLKSILNENGFELKGYRQEDIASSIGNVAKGIGSGMVQAYQKLRAVYKTVTGNVEFLYERHDQLVSEISNISKDAKPIRLTLTEGKKVFAVNGEVNKKTVQMVVDSTLEASKRIEEGVRYLSSVVNNGFMIPDYNNLKFEELTKVFQEQISKISSIYNKPSKLDRDRNKLNGKIRTAMLKNNEIDDVQLSLALGHSLVIEKDHKSVRRDGGRTQENFNFVRVDIRKVQEAYPTSYEAPKTRSELLDLTVQAKLLLDSLFEMAGMLSDLEKMISRMVTYIKSKEIRKQSKEDEENTLNRFDSYDRRDIEKIYRYYWTYMVEKAVESLDHTLKQYVVCYYYAIKGLLDMAEEACENFESEGKGSKKDSQAKEDEEEPKEDKVQKETEDTETPKPEADTPEDPPAKE